jgi:non-canonical (house-cleaning) NTP pyrophosphatase
LATNANLQQVMEVVAGSASAIKLEALRQVFPKATVSGVDVVSAVPPQPVGRLQTEEGELAFCKKSVVRLFSLRSRCRGKTPGGGGTQGQAWCVIEKKSSVTCMLTVLIFADANLWVGIENGMYQVGAEGNQKWVDAACIVVLRKLEGRDTEEIVLWSDEIEIPADFPKGPNVRATRRPSSP